MKVKPTVSSLKLETQHSKIVNKSKLTCAATTCRYIIVKLHTHLIDETTKFSAF
jgi:hypothetical protein